MRDFSTNNKVTKFTKMRNGLKFACRCPQLDYIELFGDSLTCMRPMRSHSSDVLIKLNNKQQTTLRKTLATFSRFARPFQRWKYFDTVYCGTTRNGTFETSQRGNILGNCLLFKVRNRHSHVDLLIVRFECHKLCDNTNTNCFYVSYSFDDKFE